MIRNSVAVGIQWRVHNTSINWPILFLISPAAVPVHGQRANVEEIGAMAAVLNGRVDAVLITGGMAHSQRLISVLSDQSKLDRSYRSLLGRRQTEGTYGRRLASTAPRRAIKDSGARPQCRDRGLRRQPHICDWPRAAAWTGGAEAVHEPGLGAHPGWFLHLRACGIALKIHSGSGVTSWIGVLSESDPHCVLPLFWPSVSDQNETGATDKSEGFPLRH